MVQILIEYYKASEDQVPCVGVAESDNVCHTKLSEFHLYIVRDVDVFDIARHIDEKGNIDHQYLIATRSNAFQVPDEDTIKLGPNPSQYIVKAHLYNGKPKQISECAKTMIKDEIMNIYMNMIQLNHEDDKFKQLKKRVDLLENYLIN